MTLDFINDETGFAEGIKFRNDREVRAYFTVAVQKSLFPLAEIASQGKLDEMADTVISNRWHMENNRA